MARANDPKAWSRCCPPAEIGFSNEGTLVAVTTFSGETVTAGEVKVLDVASGEWIVTLRGHTGPVIGVAYLPGDKTILTGSMDGTVRLWDAATGLQLWSAEAGVGQITSLALSHTGDRLLTGGDGGTVRLWVLGDDGIRLVATLLGHESLVLGAEFDSSGDRAASVDLDGGVLVWDVTPMGPGEVAAWPAGRPVAFSPDGSRIASTGPAARDIVIRSTLD